MNNDAPPPAWDSLFQEPLYENQDEDPYRGWRQPIRLMDVAWGFLAETGEDDAV